LLGTGVLPRETDESGEKRRSEESLTAGDELAGEQIDLTFKSVFS
jgi:hypothetical protein